MNILLIQPYLLSSVRRLYLNEPIGLLSLATYIEHTNRHKVDILDLYALGWDKVASRGRFFTIGLSDYQDILTRVKAFKPDIVGISCNFTTYSRASFEVADLIKENMPDVLVVMGGAHVSMDPEKVLRQDCKADVIVRGEGEETFAELCDCREKKLDLSPLSGITFRKGSEIVSNPKRPLMTDIDHLPIPNRKFINQDLYTNINKKMYFLAKNDRIASIMTSRGCPYNCVFCSTKAVWERKFRPRKPESVVEEISSLVNKYGVTEILINDDQFYLDKNRVISICELILERGIKISFNVTSGSSVWLIDSNLLRILKKAGLYRLTFPIESGSPQTLKYIRKPIDLAKTKLLIKTANTMGIWTYANFIIGFPFETRSDIEKTFEYAKKSGLDYATFFIAKPYAGSDMYETFREEGLLANQGFDPTTMGECDCDTKNFKAGQLQDILSKMQKDFTLFYIFRFFNPLYLYINILPKLSRGGLLYFLKYMRAQVLYFLGTFDR